MKLSNIIKYEEQIYHCSRCGLCQAVCPVYNVIRTEGSVARGKVSLMQAVLNGKLNYTPNIARYMELCTGCSACKEACPSGIPSDLIFLAAKEHAAKQFGLSMPKKAILNTFSSEKALNFFSTLLNLYSFSKAGFLLNQAPETLPFIDKIKLLNSQISDDKGIKTFDFHIKQDKPVFKLIYFPGCINKYVNSSVANATTSLLKHNNCEIVSVKDFYCCGMPAKSFGAVDIIKDIAIHNLNVFLELNIEKYDYVVVDCGSCGYMLKSYFEFFEDDSEKQDKFNILKDKIIDINELMVKLDIDLPEIKEDITVTYHDPCHLRRSQGIYKAPRALISGIKGLKFVEMKDSDTCCGGAGSFCITNSTVSKQISLTKSQNILNTGADIILTSCPSCKIGLSQGLIQNNSNLKIYHPIEFIHKIR